MKKKGIRENIFGSCDDGGGELDPNFSFIIEDNPSDVDEGIYMLGNPDSVNNQKLHEMNRIENIVNDSGWLDSSIGNIDPVDMTFKPAEERSGTQWNVLVQSLRKLFLVNHSKNLPEAKAKQKKNIILHNEVVVDDISYLQCFANSLSCGKEKKT